MAGRFETEYLDHSHLRVTSQQIREFSEAIVAFWRSVPENTLDSQVTKIPEWLQKTMLKERDST